MAGQAFMMDRRSVMISYLYFKEGCLPARIAAAVTGFIGTKANFEIMATAYIE